MPRQTRNPQAIRAAFKQEYNKDVIETVRSEVGGILESALAALLYTPSECAAAAALPFGWRTRRPPAAAAPRPLASR
jgi:hypothetical protein